MKSAQLHIFRFELNGLKIFHKINLQCMYVCTIFAQMCTLMKVQKIYPLYVVDNILE